MNEIDDREFRRARILKRMGLSFIQRRLVGADADMCNKYGRVELKELADWWQAIESNKRYWKQLYDHIIDDPRHYILIIFGNVTDTREKLKPYAKLTETKILEGIAQAFVRGAGINVVYIEKEKDAVYVGYKMLQYMEEGKWGLPKITRTSLYQRKKMGRPTPTQLQIMRIWEVSKNVAEQLERKFGSVKGICMATYGQLMLVNGVGKTTAFKIAGK